MGSFCHTPKPPPAPDPVAVSQAQAQSNIETATAQQKLNMINTHGPDGSVTYNADPTAPGGYAQVTTLSPGQQSLYDSGLQAQNSALGVANQQIGRVGDALGNRLDLSNLPSMQFGQGAVGQSQPLQYGFNPGQQVQGQVGGDLDAARYQNMAAVYGQAASRLDPMWSNRQHDLETQLANQGLGINSDAYQRAMSEFGRDRNDAYNQAIYSSVGAGENAANSLFQRQLGQGQFANEAAAQMYGQNQGQAAFHNQAVGQQFGQDTTNAQLANAQAMLQNQARNQALQEQAYVQNQPLNQFNALMSSSQVGMPQGIQYTPSQVNPTDVLGAYALNSQVQNQNYQAQMANQSSTMGGLFGLGSAAIKAGLPFMLGSDVRLKTDIRRVGTLDNGLPVYAYRYKAGGPMQIGVMAHDVAKVRPDAVAEFGGFLHVDYGAL